MGTCCTRDDAAADTNTDYTTQDINQSSDQCIDEETKSIPHIKSIFDMDMKGNNKEFEGRLIEIMCQHKKIFIDNDINDQNIIQFINSFHSTYGLIQLLNDFDKYTTKEKKK
eukprot:117814_1